MTPLEGAVTRDVTLSPIEFKQLMSVPSQTSTLSDRAAVAFSVVCIIHCLALPVIAVALPFVSAIADAEWVHWVMAVLAVLASGTVALTGQGARTPGFLAPAGIGAALVVGGLFAEGFGVDEAIPTVSGGVLIAYAHLRRIF
ncbi:MAG: MerC domain-containing protein [Pseudomonadota bacterium]